jgi:hypothetical protein
MAASSEQSPISQMRRVREWDGLSVSLACERWLSHHGRKGMVMGEPFVFGA